MAGLKRSFSSVTGSTPNGKRVKYEKTPELDCSSMSPTITSPQTPDPFFFEYTTIDPKLLDKRFNIGRSPSTPAQPPAAAGIWAEVHTTTSYITGDYNGAIGLAWKTVNNTTRERTSDSKYTFRYCHEAYRATGEFPAMLQLLAIEAGLCEVQIALQKTAGDSDRQRKRTIKVWVETPRIAELLKAVHREQLTPVSEFSDETNELSDWFPQDALNRLVGKMEDLVAKGTSLSFRYWPKKATTPLRNKAVTEMQKHEPFKPKGAPPAPGKKISAEFTTYSLVTGGDLEPVWCPEVGLEGSPFFQHMEWGRQREVCCGR